jgi:hypothetical protein
MICGLILTSVPSTILSSFFQQAQLGGRILFETRMVICSGPGNDEESSFHEKMYMIIREGPIHRCAMCGQCFKLQVLKDSITDPDNIYYSIVFTDISPRVVSEPEVMPYQLGVFVSHDLNMNQYNIMPTNRLYMMVSQVDYKG